MPCDIDSHATTVATIVLAIFAVLSFGSALAAALYAKRAVEETRRWETIRFTDLQIRDMTTQEMRDALTTISVQGEDRNAIKRALNYYNRNTALEDIPTSAKDFAHAASLYDNVLDRISAYAESKAIDEQLYFSQYDSTLVSIYVRLKAGWWESADCIGHNPRISKFITRAFLHHAAHATQILGDDDRLFMEAKAREHYPGETTELTLERYEVLRHQWFLKVT